MELDLLSYVVGLILSMCIFAVVLVALVIFIENNKGGLK